MREQRTIAPTIDSVASMLIILPDFFRRMRNTGSEKGGPVFACGFL
jgi:hypothetical protein